MPNLKIICNLDCNLFIDGDWVQEVKAEVITKVPLDVGEYYVDVVPLFNKDVSLRRFVFLEFDKILKMDLLFYLQYNIELRSKLDLVPQSNDSGLFGYNIKDTEINIIPYQYEAAEDFKDGLAIVKKGRWGVINKQEEIILGFEYDNIFLSFRYLESQENTGFIIYKNSKYGFASLTGEIIVPCLWRSCGQSCDFIFCQGERPKGDCLYNYEGKLVFTADEIKPLYFLISPPYLVFNNGKYGILDKDLNELVPVIYPSFHKYSAPPPVDYLDNTILEIFEVEADEYTCYCFEESFDDSGVSCGSSSYGRKASKVKSVSIRIYKYYHTYNNPVVVLESTLERVITVPKAVRNAELEALARRWGSSGYDYDVVNENQNVAKKEILEHSIEMLTRDGKRINLWGIDEIGEFYEEKASLRQKDRWSFVDCNGGYLCDFKYDKEGRFWMGSAIVHDEKGYGVIDKYGKEIIPCQYQAIRYSYGSNHTLLPNFFTVLDANQDEGVYDRKGTLIVPIKKGQRVSFDEKGNVYTSINEK